MAWITGNIAKTGKDNTLKKLLTTGLWALGRSESTDTLTMHEYLHYPSMKWQKHKLQTLKNLSH